MTPPGTDSPARLWPPSPAACAVPDLQTSGLPVELWARILDEAVFSSAHLALIYTNSLAELIQVWGQGQHHV